MKTSRPHPIEDFAPKNIAIMYRPSTPMAEGKAVELARWLQQRKFRVFSAPGQKILNDKCLVLGPEQLDSIDWVIVLGGDGTYLGAVRMLAGRQTPILGINMGSLGFLTEFRVEEMIDAITATLNKEMEFRPRAMLQIEILRKGKRRAQHIALNDAVLERGSVTHLINLEIVSGHNPVATVKADALIVATPTGSTAYNLAAGGPILHPDARAIVVTPVCPHALTSRPLIFPDDQRLRLRITTSDKNAILTIDGANCGEITHQDEVVVIRHHLNHFVIRRPSSNYFSLLREKLQFGLRL